VVNEHPRESILVTVAAPGSASIRAVFSVRPRHGQTQVSPIPGSNSSTLADQVTTAFEGITPGSLYFRPDLLFPERRQRTAAKARLTRWR
jgi:hypothetical protein